MVKNLSACNVGDPSLILGLERSLGDGWEWLPTPVFLFGQFHGQKSQEGYSPWGHKELDTTENPESWFFSYAIPNQELLPKACLAASPTPHSPEKTAQRNLFHLRRKTGRCLVLSVWIDVCVSVSLVIFDNSAQVLSSYFNGLKTRQPLQTQLLPIQENFDLRECQSPVNWELVNMKYLVVLFLLLYCRHV